ncbi:MAG: choice-of-anchor tandem repeat NxxGxxAF-containing protein [Phycisphaerae bacterium]
MSLAAAFLALLCITAGDDPRTPRVQITPILHTGDQAPGIPGVAIGYLFTPQIDGAGNVLISALLDDGSGRAFFYGPPGSLALIARQGGPTPDLPPGVTFSGLIGAGSLAESGTIAFTGIFQGPGVTPGADDVGLWVGTAGELHLAVRAGDPAPGTESGTVHRYNGTFAALLNDIGESLLYTDLAGPEVEETNDRGMWVGPPENRQLIWREGMEAPGTGGARFAWADGIKFNDAGAIAFRGGLVRQGVVDHANNEGYWAGGVIDLQLVAREGDQAWGMPIGVLYGGAMGFRAFNGSGDVPWAMSLTGEGVTPDNNRALWVMCEEQSRVVGRKGDSVPEVRDGVELHSVGSELINASGQLFYSVKYRGDPIDDSNAWAMHLGACDNPQQTIRDGDPAPHLPEGTVLAFVGIVPGITAMNDVGDIVTGTEIVGPDVTEDNKVVVWFHERVRAEWFPLLRSGAIVEDGVVSIPSAVDLITAYWNKTGGSDGQRQSFNDPGQLAIKLEFLDGTHGVFALRFSWPGDGDRDADVDFADFGYFQACFAASEVPPFPGCETVDFDGNGDVDLLDYDRFLLALTGAR